MSRMDPADVCASMRLRVNPCAAAMLDMAFGGDPLDGLSKEFRLVGAWRPYSDGDRELLRYAAKLEAWSAIRHAARRP
jgi:hypothetical protein